MTQILKRMTQERSGLVYRTLVQYLFSNIRILLLSVIGTAFAMALTAWETGHAPIWACTAVFLVIGVCRVFVQNQFRAVDKKAKFTNAIARRWENIFTFWSVLHSFILGVWACIACATGDPFALATSFAVTFGNLIGVCCRSYPFSRLVRFQLAVIFIPIVIGLELRGGAFMMLGLLLVPYLFSISRFASDLRDTQLNNIFQRRLAEHTAWQLDHAINNVPQGICLFDETGRLEVANVPVLRSINLSLEDIKGRSVADIVRQLSRTSHLDVNDRAVLNRWAQTPGASQFSTEFTTGDVGSRRTIRMLAKPVQDGGIVMTFQDITREVESDRQIEQMKRVDRLTGLLNRNHFKTLLSAALEKGATCCLLVINLERFKTLNQTLGHQHGDMILSEATRRLEKIARQNGLLTRYSGDEFGLAFTDDNALDMGRAVGDSIIEAMNMPFIVDSREVFPGCSIGLAFSADEEMGVDMLMKYADLALAKACKKGGNQMIEFRPELGMEAVREIQLQEDLRNAVDNDQLEAWFQPLVSLQKKRVNTCEALMRWRHPEQGMISPGVFIPMAEKLGLVNAMGDWMLLESCKVCATWPGDVNVAVNLSPAQFEEGDIVGTVKRVLEETGLAPARLELEITESLTLDDLEATIKKLNELNAIGVSISLDDFGTGYSSLSYMNSLPLDKLKIDRAFILGLDKGPKGLTLLQAIVAMARKFKFKIVVEGVEEPEQLHTVIRHGLADEIQGFIFAKPMNRADIAIELQKCSQLSSQIQSYLGTKAKKAA